MVVVVLNGKTELFLNESTNRNHWLLISLIGTKSNRDGLGTRIKITTAKGVRYNHATTAVGYNSSSDKRVHFGLGEATVVDKIELAWPSGARQDIVAVMICGLGGLRGGWNDQGPPTSRGR